MWEEANMAKSEEAFRHKSGGNEENCEKPQLE
jgi:hypothetical protein